MIGPAISDPMELKVAADLLEENGFDAPARLLRNHAEVLEQHDRSLEEAKRRYYGLLREHGWELSLNEQTQEG